VDPGDLDPDSDPDPDPQHCSYNFQYVYFILNSFIPIHDRLLLYSTTLTARLCYNYSLYRDSESIFIITCMLGVERKKLKEKRT
jgi:hypothetical protein